MNLTEEQARDIRQSRIILSVADNTVVSDAARRLLAIIDKLTDRRVVDDRRGTATAEQERAWRRSGMVKRRVGVIDRRKTPSSASEPSPLQGNAESPSSSDLNATGGISRPPSKDE